ATNLADAPLLSARIASVKGPPEPVLPTSPGPMMVQDLRHTTVAPAIVWLLRSRVARSSRKTELADDGHTRSASRDPVCLAGTLWPQAVMLTSAPARLQTTSNADATTTKLPDFAMTCICSPFCTEAARVACSRVVSRTVPRGDRLPQTFRRR